MRYRLEATYDSANGVGTMEGKWKATAEKARAGWKTWWSSSIVTDVWLAGEDGSRERIAGGPPRPPAHGWAAEIERACREADAAEGIPGP